MKKFLLFLFLSFSIMGFCQHGNKTGKGKINMSLLAGDSVIMKLEKLKDSVLNARRIQENVNRNANEIFQLQKERHTKQKNMAILRIIIGIALLVVLVIGLRRKGTKQ
ncbi:MAG: hypothetical protein ABJA85_06680 [Bacteroidota bacterium]